MDTARRKRIEALFEESLEIPEPERDAWLARQCAGDAELEAEVRNLLRAHDRAGILELNAVDLAARLHAGQDEGRRVGQYRIIRELGRGGMAVVYLAVREDGHFRQRVALKLLQGSADAGELYARFLAERQILAALQHPNISQMLDGGIADGQLPYLVMEYVEGVPITTYCDRRQLDIATRLRLFLDACAAVQHAHKNLVLHRDLKPANILVTDDGQVKLLDFGIAKLLNPLLAEQPITRHDLRLLTPEYASPEQIRGEALSTASDVYSLGVVLYELLTGQPPYRLTGAPHELASLVSDRDPERPSAVVVSRDTPADVVRAAAAARGSTPERLRKILQGDLDAIVARALRKEAALRYGTAEMLADDVQRYLEGRPVHATRGSTGYRARKFLRRHRVQAFAGALIFASLSAGAGIASWQATSAHRAHHRAEAALREAEQALRQSEEITAYLISLFEAGDPNTVGGNQLTAQDLLRRGVRRADELADQPLVQAAMLDALGKVQRSLGEYAEARLLLERSLLIREQQSGPNHPTLAATLAELADVLRLQGLFPEALQRAERALAIRQSSTAAPTELAESQIQVAGILVYLGDVTSATDLVRRAVDALEAAEPRDDRALAGALMRLGSMHQRTGNYVEAEAVFRRMLEHTRRTLPADDPLTGDALLNIGYLLMDVPARLAEAERLLQAGLDVRRRALGPAHPLTGHALADVAQAQITMGRFDEGLENLRQHVTVLERAFGPDYPIVSDGIGRLADGYREAGRFSDSEREYARALDLAMRTHGPNHTATAGILSGFARLRFAQKRYAEAEEAQRRAISIRERALGPTVALVGYMKGALAEILIEQERYTEAELLLNEGLELAKQNAIDPRHRDYQLLLRRMVALYERWGKPESAEPFRRLMAQP